MKSPDLKQVELAARSFWFEREEPRTEEETELFNAFDSKGLQVYRRLLRNDWQETLESIYPLSQKVIAAEWTDVITRYIKAFPPEHFNLNRLAKMFAPYLLEHEQQLPDFLPELADYEWLELEIMEHPGSVDSVLQSAPETVKDFLELNPAVNPTLSIRTYSFKIQEIAKEIQQDGDIDLSSLSKLSKSSSIAAFRPPRHYYCEFLELSKAEAVLLRSALMDAHKYGELAKMMISRRPDTAPETISLQFINTVERFHKAGIFV